MYDETGHLVGEYNSTGALVQETVWLGDIPVATLRGTSVFYVHTDQLNTPRKVTSNAATPVLRWRWDPSPFGDGGGLNENPGGAGAFKYQLRFPGQYFDTESNLNYNYRRDYDPAIARYLESDPIGLEGGINTYSYTANSPLMYSDPSGESLVLEAPIVIGGGLLIGACIASEGCSQIIRGAIEAFINASSEAATRAEYCRDHCSKELEKNPHRPKDRRPPSDIYTNNFHKCFLKCMAGDECE